MFFFYNVPLLLYHIAHDKIESIIKYLFYHDIAYIFYRWYQTLNMTSGRSWKMIVIY